MKNPLYRFTFKDEMRRSDAMSKAAREVKRLRKEARETNSGKLYIFRFIEDDQGTAYIVEKI